MTGSLALVAIPPGARQGPNGAVKGRMVLAAVVLVLAVAAPALADPGHDVPDFSSAVPIPSDSDYQITADGHLIYEGDMVINCEDVHPDFITSARRRVSRQERRSR